MIDWSIKPWANNSFLFPQILSNNRKVLFQDIPQQRPIELAPNLCRLSMQASEYVAERLYTSVHSLKLTAICKAKQPEKYSSWLQLKSPNWLFWAHTGRTYQRQTLAKGSVSISSCPPQSIERRGTLHPIGLGWPCPLCLH